MIRRLKGALRSRVLYEFLLVLLIAHLLYRNVPASINLHDRNESEHQKTVAWSNAYLYVYKFIQCYFIQITYIYYLYQCNVDDD